MAVLINGMEMPLPGTFNIIYIYSDGQVHMPSWGKGMTPTNGVKAIPIPPHGLIDRERILDSIRIELAQVNAVNDMDDYDEWMRVFDYIRKFPTVIPASEEG